MFVIVFKLSDNFKQRGKIKDKEIGGKRNGMEK